MADPAFTFLPLLDRTVVSVVGADAVAFLDNLATNALDQLKSGDARFSALLTPQGKITFEFFALRTFDGFLLETHRASAAELVKRLSLYKLRAKVTFKDEGAVMLVAASPERPADRATVSFPDPRNAALGYRVLSRDPTLRLLYDPAQEQAYHRIRIGLGVPAGGLDYSLGDTFPHEANYDRIAGVSFSKGCFVGQEVVARMQNKTVVRKRVVKVMGEAALHSGASVQIGDAEIGRIGSTDGVSALALLRLDRALEAAKASQPLTADGVILTVAPDELALYAQSVANKPIINL
jgi:tRNA-modifying protein YgfZ